MITTLVVLSHPSAQSFNSAWAAATCSYSKASGHTVLQSNLYQQRFDPVERAEHYALCDDHSFDPLKAQEQAAANDSLPSDVRMELDKLKQADRVIIHFPLWWFGPPAMLKGWFDRVLVHGAIHSVDRRFDRGQCLGKKALFCVTTGASASETSASGREGDVRLLLWPLAYALRYLGFTVLEPHFCHDVHGYHDSAGTQKLERTLTDALQAHRKVINDFDAFPVIRFNRDTDFTDHATLKADAPMYSFFIRH